MGQKDKAIRQKDKVIDDLMDSLSKVSPYDSYARRIALTMAYNQWQLDYIDNLKNKWI